MYNELCQLLSNESVRMNEPMQKHTTFKIGGPVDILVSPKTIAELQTTLKYCKTNNVPLLILGLGSNILVRDKGIRGVALEIGNNLKEIQISGEEIYAQAGVRLSELAYMAAAHCLSGLEFAEGIPGSLGGAVVMNAGAYDGEIKDVVLAVEAISPTGESQTFTCTDIGYDYRKSIFQHNGYVVVAARLRLKKREQHEIESKMHHYASSRREKQPLEYPSAGSVFRRPPGFFVGPMIEKLGLKGYTVGGAQVSTKHAGFIINTGNASATDVLNLIDIITRAAQENFGVKLQTEIRVVGEE